MKKVSTKYAAMALFLSLFTLGLSPLSSATQATVRKTVQAGNSIAQIGFSAGNQKVYLNWARRIGPGHVVRAMEVLPVSFRPTSVSDVGNGRLAIGGHSHVSGNTIVQVWQLRNPAVVQAYPSGEEKLLPQGVSRVVVLQDENVASRKNPQFISAFSKAAVSFVVGYDSGEVWEYSLDLTPKKLVADTVGGTGVFQIPVSPHHYPVYSADHQDHGEFILFLSRSPSKPWLLLWDVDRNGRVDGAQTLSAAQRVTLDLDNRSKHL